MNILPKMKSSRLLFAGLLLILSSTLFCQNEAAHVMRLLNKADSMESVSPSLSRKLAEDALELSLKLKNDSLELKSRFTKGVASFFMGDQNEALENFIKSKELALKQKNDTRLIECLNAIGNVYKDIDHYQQALQSFNEALVVCRRNDNGGKQLLVEGNMAGAYYYLKKYDSSNYYCYRVLHAFSKSGSKNYGFVSGIYTTLLTNYCDLRLKDSITKYTDTTLALLRIKGDMMGYAGTLYNLGSFYFLNKDFKRSEKYLRSALDLKPENIELFADIESQLASTLYELKAYQEAADLYWASLRLRDSIHKVQSVEELSEMEVKYETGKKEGELKRLSVEKENDDLRLKQSRFLLIVFIVGILFCAIMVYLLFRQNRNRQKANQLLRSQNDEILHQKKEITDSISYAKRIQKAILPPDHMVERLLPSSFILYIPKDVVSGDFYWLEERNGLVMFAAVDCTGHGVPGAMMSVIGMNLLNQAVKEKGLTVPADILQHLDTGVTDTLRQYSGAESVKDGMDLSLCTFNSKTLELQFAGAFNNLWLVRRNAAALASSLPAGSAGVYKEDLLELKADKFPIGSNLDGVADTYTNHSLHLQKGDCIYLYSDGFADQFGGPKGKKFKYNALKDLLISVHDLSPALQRERLAQAFAAWKGNLEQVDDILVIGVKV